MQRYNLSGLTAASDFDVPPHIRVMFGSPTRRRVSSRTCSSLLHMLPVVALHMPHLACSRMKSHDNEEQGQHWCYPPHESRTYVRKCVTYTCVYVCLHLPRNQQRSTSRQVLHQLEPSPPLTLHCLPPHQKRGRILGIHTQDRPYRNPRPLAPLRSGSRTRSRPWKRRWLLRGDCSAET